MSAAFELLWADACERLAISEGWNLFALGGDTTRVEIECLDTPEEWPGAPVDPPWVDDDEVVAHCAVEAIFGGSPVHALALQFEYRTHRQLYDRRS